MFYNMACLTVIQYADHLKAILNISILSRDVCNIIINYTIKQKTINFYLQCASMDGNLEIVKYMIKTGAQITADDNEAVFRAYKNNRQIVVKYLCDNKAVLGKRAWEDGIGREFMKSLKLSKIYV